MNLSKLARMVNSTSYVRLNFQKMHKQQFLSFRTPRSSFWKFWPSSGKHFLSYSWLIWLLIPPSQPHQTLPRASTMRNSVIDQSPIVHEASKILKWLYRHLVFILFWVNNFTLARAFLAKIPTGITDSHHYPFLGKHCLRFLGILEKMVLILHLL